MKKSENLILRVDPELKSILDKKAEEKNITTSEMVRNVLSVVFLSNYEDQKFIEYVKDDLKRNKDSLRIILDNPLIEKNPRLKNSVIENLRYCDEILENLGEGPKNKIEFKSLITD